MKAQTKTERALISRVLGLLPPPAKRTVSEWADEFRRIPADSSPEPGRWRTSRTEYMREIMDTVNDPDVERTVVVMGSQGGKTEALLNIAAYYIDQDPSPIMLVMPTLTLATDFSKDRLAPMFRDTPQLAGKIKDARTRDSGNSLLNKSYPGGQFTLAGANSPASLASRPKRVVLYDEVKSFPQSAGTEGDPVDIAAARVSNFHDSKLIMTSTPSIDGRCRIQKEWNESDQRYYHVRCPNPECGHEQTLIWEQIKYPIGKPKEAYYECPQCAHHISDKDKIRMVRAGRWIPTKPFTGVRGFKCSQLYSPWRKWAQIAAGYEKAMREGSDAMKAFTNVVLGNWYKEQRSEMMEWETLSARCEDYKPMTIPLGGVRLTCGVDVQRSPARLAVVVRAWGEDMESWLVHHEEIPGSPAKPEVWRKLDELLEREWQHESGQLVRILCTAVDSGDGSHTQTIYNYCWDRPGKRVIAIKGSSTPGKPIRGTLAKKNIDHQGRAFRNGDVWMVGSDTAKDVIYDNLRKVDGPGMYHWYVGTSEEYFRQLLSEHKIVTEDKRTKREKTKYIQNRPRNEAIDCEVYALVAAYHAGVHTVNMRALTKKLKLGTLNVQQATAITVPEPSKPSPLPLEIVIEEPEAIVLTTEKPQVDRDLVRFKQRNSAAGRYGAGAYGGGGGGRNRYGR